jgi:hypothetical protein
MTAAAYFAGVYAEARAKFLEAASAAGATVTSYTHSLKGPDGEELAIDVSRQGPESATKALVLSSGTHGVEGFCGSGCQVGFLKTGFADRLPADTALVMVHAHNPHGFANQRRVNEDNIDLNRNFIDFGAGLPDNPDYDEIHPWMVPDDWDGPSRQAADAAIMAYIEERGLFAFQAAMSGGQHHHPDGLFYGGQAPTWSRRTIEDMARAQLDGCRHVGLIDFHTGLGPRGFGEIIGIGGPEDAMYQRARQWYGEEAKSPESGDSVSAVVRGTVEHGYEQILPRNVELTGVAIEYGTLPPEQVLESLRADNWLYLKGDLNSAVGREIKQAIRDAFYGDDDEWKTMIWERANDVAGKAIMALANT